MNHAEAGRLGYIKIKDKFDQQREKQHKEAYDKFLKEAKKCLYCGTDLPYEKRSNKFCSHSCAGSFNNKGVCRNGKPLEKKKCMMCDNTVKHRNGKYCSKICEVNHKWILKKESIEKGESCEPRVLKKYIKEKNGEVCSICGLTKWRGKAIPLVMDHINGNHKNNDPSNLRLVCGNCDMQLPTYKSKNMGNGRHKRRQRYAEGKSY